MLTMLVYLLARLRRYLKKATRGMSRVADGVAEAQQLRRAALRRYPYVGE